VLLLPGCHHLSSFIIIIIIIAREGKEKAHHLPAMMELRRKSNRCISVEIGRDERDFFFTRKREETRGTRFRSSPKAHRRQNENGLTKRRVFPPHHHHPNEK